MMRFVGRWRWSPPLMVRLQPKLVPGMLAMKINESLANIILDALSAHIAILDENGVILKTNRAWLNFAQDNRLQASAEASPIN